MEAIETINESTKVMAQVLEIIKKANDTGIVSAPDLQLAQKLLEDSLDRLTTKI